MAGTQFHTHLISKELESKIHHRISIDFNNFVQHNGRRYVMHINEFYLTFEVCNDKKLPKFDQCLILTYNCG